MSISSKSNRPVPVILLFGPTGVGKTAILFHLAENLIYRGLPPMEVISADSMQVYRGMDIGTAKPSLDEREVLRHHLIDIADPDEQFDLGDFVRETDNLIPQLTKRNIIPVISGGTAYYFKHYLYGLPKTPSVTKDIRIMVEDMSKALGNEALKKMLFQIDPVSAERIHLNDTYRLSRALEVYYATGKPLSSFSLPDNPRTDILPMLIGLKRPREELYQRINDRVDLMFEAGLVEEAENLFELGYRQNDPGMRGIGYSEFFNMGWFDKTRKSPALLDALKTQIRTDSRRYAKRQITFFSSLHDAIWKSPDDTNEIIHTIISFLKDSLV